MAETSTDTPVPANPAQSGGSVLDALVRLAGYGADLAKANIEATTAAAEAAKPKPPSWTDKLTPQVLIGGGLAVLVVLWLLFKGK